MRILKGTFATLMGFVLIYVQLFESRPALCASPECVGFNIVWLGFFCLGAYALWRGGRMLLSREHPLDAEDPEQPSVEAPSTSTFADKPLDRARSEAGQTSGNTRANTSVFGSE